MSKDLEVESESRGTESSGDETRVVGTEGRRKTPSPILTRASRTLGPTPMVVTSRGWSQSPGPERDPGGVGPLPRITDGTETVSGHLGPSSVSPDSWSGS